MTTLQVATKAAMGGLSAPETITASSGDGVGPWRPAFEVCDATLRAAADACSVFISEIERGGIQPRWLTLNGEAGCGKTMLARQVFNRSLASNPGAAPLWVDPNQQPGGKAKRRPRCVWLDASEMAERMKAGEYDLPEYLADDFLVVLDDLGAVRDKTDFMADAVYRLCQQRRDRWTVFTTNLTLAEISSKVDERVASRLIRDRNVQVRITAGDYALRRARTGTPLNAVVISPPDDSREPANWREWLKTHYSGESWSETALAYSWGRLPANWRAKIHRELANVA